MADSDRRFDPKSPSKPLRSKLLVLAVIHDSAGQSVDSVGIGTKSLPVVTPASISIRAVIMLPREQLTLGALPLPSSLALAAAAIIISNLLPDGPTALSQHKPCDRSASASFRCNKWFLAWATLISCEVGALDFMIVLDKKTL